MHHAAAEDSPQSFPVNNCGKQKASVALEFRANIARFLVEALVGERGGGNGSRWGMRAGGDNLKRAPHRHGGASRMAGWGQH
jgi:hypothetical protein